MAKEITNLEQMLDRIDKTADEETEVSLGGSSAESVGKNELQCA